MNAWKLGLLFGIGVVATAHAQASRTECKPQRDNLRPGQVATLRPGRYELILVAVVGSNAGSSTEGTLWLWHTTSHDRSPRTGEQAVSGDTVEFPLYGATDVDFRRIGAPMAADSFTPDPASRDPVYPGVLVGWTPSDSSRIPSLTLLIGTVTNPRTGRMVTDGAGIQLRTRAFTSSHFAGSWGEYGIVYNGSGYFCARYLGS